jgi:hypothetical protein
MKHFIIPDTQCKPKGDTAHLTAAGNYIAAKQPDKIIHLGDHFDMQSLSSYDKKTKRAEGTRYQLDIDAGIEGMEALIDPITRLQRKQRRRKGKVYNPEMHFLLGNHEERIMRHVNASPELSGKLSYADLELERFGWTVHDFTEVVNLDGVSYSHYFYNPNTGRPLGGVAHTRLKNVGFSFTMGHQQGKDQAERYLSNGQVHRALIVGSFYPHDEHYKGPQGNEHWRGCIMKHEVANGNYDIMEVSLNYLMENYK